MYFLFTTNTIKGWLVKNLASVNHKSGSCNFIICIDKCTPGGVQSYCFKYALIEIRIRKLAAIFDELRLEKNL